MRLRIEWLFAATLVVRGDIPVPVVRLLVQNWIGYNRWFSRLQSASTGTGRSSNGRTRGSGPRYRGSNPCLPANFTRSARWLLGRSSDFDRLALLAVLGTNSLSCANCLNQLHQSS